MGCKCSKYVNHLNFQGEILLVSDMKQQLVHSGTYLHLQVSLTKVFGKAEEVVVLLLCVILVTGLYWVKGHFEFLWMT